MPMRRREKHVTGYVRFPIDDPEWNFSAEGGMFVRAMVLDDRNHANGVCWMECCGGPVTVTMDETPQMDGGLEKRLWPRMYDANGKLREERTAEDYESVPCLATVVLGSTGWAGWSEKLGRYWQCTEADLTDDGRELLAALRRLYAGHEVVLRPRSEKVGVKPAAIAADACDVSGRAGPPRNVDIHHREPRRANPRFGARPLFAAAERIIQLVEDAEPFVDGSARRERPESRLCVMLRDGDGAQLFHELVDAHGALSRESLHSCVRVAGETDGQCGHG